MRSSRRQAVTFLLLAASVGPACAGEGGGNRTRDDDTSADATSHGETGGDEGDSDIQPPDGGDTDRASDAPDDEAAIDGGGEEIGDAESPDTGDVDGPGDGDAGDDARDDAGGGFPTVDPGIGCPIFPLDNPWNQDISGAPLHPDSDAFIDSIGRNETLHADFGTVWEGAPIGIPFVIVDGTQQRVPISFEYADESDPGPYPIPPDAPIEGGPDGDGDRHILVIDAEACVLWEVYAAWPIDDGAAWECGSGAVFDLRSNDLRPAGWTSADAAGLPIFPGLVRYDEVMELGEIDHALRFTVSRSRRAYIPPATHAASSNTDASVPPMGLRLRMRADYDCSSLSDEVQVICRGLKRYGMFVADNGSDWYISGAPDSRWNDDALHDMSQIPGSAFEVVFTGDAIPWGSD